MGTYRIQMGTLQTFNQLYSTTILGSLHKTRQTSQREYHRPFTLFSLVLLHQQPGFTHVPTLQRWNTHQKDMTVVKLLMLLQESLFHIWQTFLLRGWKPKSSNILIYFHIGSAGQWLVDTPAGTKFGRKKKPSYITKGRTGCVVYRSLSIRRFCCQHEAIHGFPNSTWNQTFPQRGVVLLWSGDVRPFCSDLNSPPPILSQASYQLIHSELCFSVLFDSSLGGRWDCFGLLPWM